MRKLHIAVVCAALAASGGAFARSAQGNHHSSHHSSISQHGTYHSHRSNYAMAAQRDSHGRIKRSRKAIYEFRGAHPCPSTGKTTGACPGYVIDHIQPLKRGGADAPYNMQWQTIENGKAKDRTE